MDFELILSTAGFNTAAGSKFRFFFTRFAVISRSISPSDKTWRRDWAVADVFATGGRLRWKAEVTEGADVASGWRTPS